jgi:hypothetical protein
MRRLFGRFWSGLVRKPSNRWCQATKDATGAEERQALTA